MDILVQRGPSSEKSTIDELSIDGGFHCFCLEPPVRAPGVKIAGKTAIPANTYEVVIDFSPHFNRSMPEIVGVPNFSGVRFHWGDYPSDTEGCLITGYTKAADFVGESRVAFEALFGKIEAALKAGDKVRVKIADWVAPPASSPSDIAPEEITREKIAPSSEMAGKEEEQA